MRVRDRQHLRERLGKLHRSFSHQRIGAAVARRHARRDEPRRVPHEHQRGGVAHELDDRDPARERAQGRGHRAPPDGHRIAPLWCQALRCASIRRTPSVTACTLSVAPEMLRISFPTRSESPALLPRNWRRQGSYATSPPYGSRYTRMSTSLRRSAGSIATRKVIGWSLPSTLPTAAKPSSESARDTRSTRTVSTSRVSTRVPDPNNRAIAAPSFAGGAAGFCTVSRRTASASVTSKLVSDAQAQHF